MLKRNNFYSGYWMRESCYGGYYVFYVVLIDGILLNILTVVDSSRSKFKGINQAVHSKDKLYMC